LRGERTSVLKCSSSQHSDPYLYAIRKWCRLGLRGTVRRLVAGEIAMSDVFATEIARKQFSANTMVEKENRITMLCIAFSLSGDLVMILRLDIAFHIQQDFEGCLEHDVSKAVEGYNKMCTIFFWQIYGRSPVCVRIWSSSRDVLRKEALQGPPSFKYTHTCRDPSFLK
jgi:hypothetical protein